jgi:hypothetical protein
MAGSYNHIVTNSGNLVSNERFVQMIENLGDAYEMTEEMYGMIWYLAKKLAPSDDARTEVEEARQNYTYGLTVAKEANRRRPNGS